MTSVLKNQKGISLIEVIVSVGIAGVIMISMLAMMQLMNQNSNRLTIGITKNEIITKIRLNSLNLSAIEASARLTNTLGSAGMTPNVGASNSAPNSNALYNCLPNLAGAGCNKTTMDDARGFKFYLSSGASEDSTLAVAGEDIFYSIKGIRCSSAEAAVASQCPLMASVWAEPFCSGFSTTCSKAIAMTVRYRVEMRPDYSGEALMAPLEGEIYLTLTKGIQLSRLLSQVDNPVQINSTGIYSVQKYFGYADQVAQPTGLRFEAILGNPTGLVSMKLQYRTLTGINANSYMDDSIPTQLNSATWVDVGDPLSPSTPWTVLLTGAKPSQIINFGTQTSAAAAGTVAKDFKIGATTADTPANQAKFLWSIDGTGSIVPPTFRSGFYQFRVLASDSSGSDVESMNYITVRIVPRPQVIIPASQPALNQTRNCISSVRNISYRIALADDEGLGDQTLKLGASDVSFSQVSGTSGYINIPFDLGQSITSTTQTFGYSYTAKNKFTGGVVNFITVPITSGSFNVNLAEKPISDHFLTSAPSKVRLNTTGVATVTIDSGSCCNQDPTVSWTYPSIPEVAAPLLSGNAVSLATCVLDAANNRRTCSANVTVTGIKESPASTASSDIQSRMIFTTTNNACTGGTGVGTYQNSAYIPVIKIPGIQFYLAESLWLNLPTNPIAAPQGYQPRAYVRADFQPEEPVTVGVYSASDTLICSIEFAAGTGTNPIDQPCNIPGGYSGNLSLRRISSNIMLDTDIAGPTFKAKLVSGRLNHRSCQPNLQSIPEFANYTVPSNQPMLNSPWGFTTSGTNIIQDPKNDSGLWPAGVEKQFRCYDRWNGMLAATPYTNADVLNIAGYGTVDINIQDVYRLHRYNTEIKPASASVAHLIINASKSRYQTYIFPDNPNLDFDAKNVPYLFAVFHNSGAPGSATWNFNSPVAGGNASSGLKSWTDYTPQLCSGGAQLSTIKIFGMKAAGNSTAETVMKANNNVSTLNGTGFYSYSFMCAFGRWNPFSKASTSWAD